MTGARIEEYPGVLRRDPATNMEAARLMTQGGFKGLIAASARFDDEVIALKEAGVHAAYNFFAEAGAGLAEAAYEKLESQLNGHS